MASSEVVRSLAMVRVGGRLYPARTVAECDTCNSSHRAEIEHEVLSGKSVRTVERWLEATYPDEKTPARESIRRHLNNHIPLAAAIQHKIIEDRSQEIGQSIEDAAGAVADHVAVNRIIVQRGLERLTAGEIEPTMAELLTAIRQQQQIDAEHEGGLDAEVWRQAMMEYMKIMAGILSPAQRAEFTRQAASSSVLRALSAQVVEGSVA